MLHIYSLIVVGEIRYLIQQAFIYYVYYNTYSITVLHTMAIFYTGLCNYRYTCIYMYILYFNIA